MSANSSYSEADDSLFDNCEDEDDDWGEVEEMEDNTSKNNNRIETAENRCWKCCGCHIINNVRLTMQQYDWKCCGCRNISYLPNETPIIYTSKWNTNNDYKIKYNVDKQIKIWICQYCTFNNENLNSSTCQICDYQRQSTAITKFIDIPKEKGEATMDKHHNINNNALCDKQKEDRNDFSSLSRIKNIDLEKEIYADIKRLKMQKKTVKIKTERERIQNRIQEKMQRIEGIEIEIDPWQCPDCHHLNHIIYSGQNQDKCKQCQCNKPQKIPNLKGMVELIVFGFCEEICRRNENNMNIPIAIQKMIYKYYDNVKNQDLFGRIYKNNWISIRDCKYRKYLCQIQNNYCIKGRYIACNYMGIYRWRFRIKANKSPLKGIGIGLINTKFLNENHEKDTIENHENHTKDGNVLILNYKSRKGYCPAFHSDDIITMELNFIDRTLSFGINDEWYGIFTNIRCQHYQTVIHTYYAGVDIENIDLDIVELGKQTKHDIKPKPKREISYHPSFGTFGYDFKPYQQFSNRDKKIFYYQHLCVGNNKTKTNPFCDKSTEELQFEDIYGNDMNNDDMIDLGDNRNDENYINDDINDETIKLQRMLDELHHSLQDYEHDAITNSKEENDKGLNLNYKENTIDSNQYDKNVDDMIGFDDNRKDNNHQNDASSFKGDIILKPQQKMTKCKPYISDR